MSHRQDERNHNTMSTNAYHHNGIMWTLVFGPIVYVPGARVPKTAFWISMVVGGAVSLANHLSGVADALRSLRTDQRY